MKVKLFASYFDFSSVDTWLGLLMALQIGFLHPYYIFSFLPFALASFRIYKSKTFKFQKVIFVLMFVSGIISSAFSVYDFKIDMFRAVYSSIVFVFFLY